MSPLKTAIIVALATSTLTAGALFQWNRHRAREAGNLRFQNSRLRMEILQRRAGLAKEAVASGATGPAATVGNAPAASTPSRHSEMSPQPATAYRDEGQATPHATLQTFAWACDRGDVGKVGSLIHIDPAARTKAEAFLASLPGEARGQWKSIDEMAATLLTHQGVAAPFPSSDILATATIENLGEDRVALLLPNTLRSRTEFLKTMSGWKYVVTERMVDDYVRQASQRQ